MDKVNGVKNMMESGYPPSDAERAGLSRFVLKSLLLLSASLAKDLRSRKNLPADVLTCINVFVCLLFCVCVPAHFETMELSNFYYYFRISKYSGKIMGQRFLSFCAVLCCFLFRKRVHHLL